MYRRLTKYVLSMLAILLIAGCSYDTEITSAVQERVPVTFELKTAPFNITRSTTYENNLWSAGMNVSVKCTADGESANLNDTKTYVTASNGSGGFKLEGINVANTFYWLDRSAAKSFELWYPSGDDIRKSQSVLDDQTSADLASYDLLFASTTVSNAAASTVASLAFFHQMSCVIVNITEVPVGEEVTGVSFGSSNVAVKGTLSTAAMSNYSTSSSSGGATWSVVSTDKINTIELKELASNKYCCILPPQSFGDGSTTLLTITTKETATPTTTHSYSCTGAMSLYAGNLHTIDVNIAIGLSFKTTVEDWPTSGDNFHTGTATY